MLSQQSRRGIVLLSVTLCVVIAVLVEPMAQDPTYHQFADKRTLVGIANFFNVVSNIPFLIVGVVGGLRYTCLAHNETRVPYAFLCLGIVLVGVGSAYYHTLPNNESLLWDRLPMTVVLMALLVLILNERVLAIPSVWLLWPSLIAGVGATLYWSWTEALGRGDLRPYALVQFVPVMLVPLALLLFPQKYLHSRQLFGAFALYSLAKIGEHFDKALFLLTGLTGGHALKHLLAAAAVLSLVYAVPARNLPR